VRIQAGEKKSAHPNLEVQMKELTAEQRENREIIVEAILHPHMHKATAEHLAEEIVQALTAHTEPYDENQITLRKYREWEEYKDGKAAWRKFPYWLQQEDK